MTKLVLPVEANKEGVEVPGKGGICDAPNVVEGEIVGLAAAPVGEERGTALKNCVEV